MGTGHAHHEQQVADPLGSSTLRVSFKALPLRSISLDVDEAVGGSNGDIVENMADTAKTAPATSASAVPLQAEHSRKRSATNPFPSSQSKVELSQLSEADAAVAELQRLPQDHSRLPSDPRKRPNSFSGPTVSNQQQMKPSMKGTSHSVGSPRQEALSTSKHLIPLSEIGSSSPRRRMTSSHKKQSSGIETDLTDKEKGDHKFVRRLTRQKSEKEVLVGTPVKEGHQNFVLMYDMLMGIRVSVSRCQAKPSRVLVKEDFIASHKMTFDIAGTELTPSSRYDFKFKDYAPWVFRCVRDAFNIDPAEYLLSLTGKYVLSELGSPGKSGSFFYYSSDYRYIIKTIKRAEKKAFMGFIHWYYEHCRTNPDTTLCRILGLHRVKLKGNRKLHFVVMLNVFPPNKDIHEMYDLKGSRVGREFPEELAKDDPRAVLKDINWLNRKRKLELGPTKAKIFIEQLEKDMKFLARHKIMDYSLLIGIHDMKRGNTENIRDKTLAVYEPNPDASLSRQVTVASLMMSRPGAGSVTIPPDERNTSATSIPHSSHRLSMGVHSTTSSRNPRNDPTVSMTTPVANGVHAAAAAGRQVLPAPTDLVDSPEVTDVTDVNEQPERATCIFYSDDGGYQASDDHDQPLDKLYYLGTIDIFTTYDIVKSIEHLWKSFSQDAHGISAVPPAEYGVRFFSFMKGIIRQPGEGAVAEAVVP